MCKFFSAIVLKNGDVLWHEATDSHSDLVAHYKLPDRNTTKHFAKVEFTPAEKNGIAQYGDVSGYTLRVDEDTEPTWFEEIRNGVTKKCREIVKSMIVDDARPLVLGGCRILVSGAKINNLKSSRVISMYGTSRVISMYGTSRVISMYDTSRVISMYDTSSVGSMYGTSRVISMYGTSSVGSMYDTSSATPHPTYGKNVNIPKKAKS